MIEFFSLLIDSEFNPQHNFNNPCTVLLEMAAQQGDVKSINKVENKDASWAETEVELWLVCRYNVSYAGELDQSLSPWIKLQQTWDALEARGILVPCERIRK